MRTLTFLLCIVAVGTLTTSCQSADQAATAPTMTPVKGYELYSWQDGGTWYFSLMTGTNREKTLDEIKAPSETLRGIDELREALEQIAAGQYITWLSRETLAWPPDDLVSQVEQICGDQDLELAIVR